MCLLLQGKLSTPVESDEHDGDENSEQVIYSTLYYIVIAFLTLLYECIHYNHYNQH